jgi:hypothetical protein
MHAFEIIPNKSNLPQAKPTVRYCGACGHVQEFEGYSPATCQNVNCTAKIPMVDKLIPQKNIGDRVKVWAENRV